MNSKGPRQFYDNVVWSHLWDKLLLNNFSGLSTTQAGMQAASWRKSLASSSRSQKNGSYWQPLLTTLLKLTEVHQRLCGPSGCPACNLMWSCLVVQGLATAHGRALCFFQQGTREGNFLSLFNAGHSICSTLPWFMLKILPTLYTESSSTHPTSWGNAWTGKGQSVLNVPKSGLWTVRFLVSSHGKS